MSIIISTLAVVIISALFAVGGRASNNHSIDKDFKKARLIDEVLYAETSDKLFTQRQLPLVISTDNSFDVIVVLPNEPTEKERSISIFVTYMDFSVEANGKEIYRYSVNPNNFIKSGGYAYHIIDLPEDFVGNRLKISFNPLLRYEHHYKVLTMYYGSRSNIILTQFLKDIGTIIFFILMVLFSLLCVIFASFDEKKTKNKLIAIGSLALLIGTYMFSQIRMVAFYFRQYHSLIYMIEFTTLMLLPTPAYSLLKGRLDPKYDKLLNSAIVVSLVNIIVQYCIVLLQKAEFKELLKYTHLTLIYGSSAIFISLVFTNGKKYPEKRRLMITIIPIFVTVVSSLVYYVIYNIFTFEKLIIMSMIVFITTQCYMYISDFLTFYYDNIKNNVYREMALIDVMTGIKNRSSFEQFVVKINQSCWIFSFDLNNLKYINDNYGHSYGDIALMQFASSLTKVFQTTFKYELFRIGGDEFIVFLFADNSVDIDAILFHLDMQDLLIQEINEKISYAVGYAYYYEGINTIQEVIKQSDDNMYRDKTIKKQGDRL